MPQLTPAGSVVCRILVLLSTSVFQARALRTAAAGTSSAAFLEQLHNYTFAAFVKEYGRRYEEGSEEYELRESIFTQNLKSIVDFHSGPEQGWKMGVNNFMDFTEAEKRRMLGYKGSGGRKSHAGFELRSNREAVELPEQFFVHRPKAKLMDIVRDQGSCGSCWAQAAIATLEGQLEATSSGGLLQVLKERHDRGNASVPQTPTLSVQTIISCTDNPRHCGGTGQCGGATVELAYDMIRSRGGLPFAKTWPHESGSGAEPHCKNDVFGTSMVSISGYTVLPSNRLEPLKNALVTSGGPIAVSVDASRWFMYWSGIYNDRGRGLSATAGDFTVNHAVTLMGYQNPAGMSKGFWKIKNSWGQTWGELGYIRIEMKENEEGHCGWDYKTHDGIACDGDPDKAWVCGTCGILYDSVYPTGIHVK